MKLSKYLLPFSATFLSALILAIGLFFLVSSETLPPGSLESAKGKHSVLENSLKAREERLNALSGEEEKLQNYQNLWKKESERVPNVESFVSALNRLAARSNILFRETTAISENWDSRQTLELELSGNFEALFEWMNTVENAFFSAKFLTSDWLRIDGDLTQLTLTTAFFNHEPI